jgi:hypothetical protein
MKRSEPIGSELLHVQRHDVGVNIVQKIVRGADKYLDKRVTLYLSTPNDAIKFALGILEQNVPAMVLKKYAVRLQSLANLGHEPTVKTGKKESADINAGINLAVGARSAYECGCVLAGKVDNCPYHGGPWVRNASPDEPLGNKLDKEVPTV